MPRHTIQVEGIVQGVGFRPFVYNLAVSLGLAGWVLNDSHGVTIEVEGDSAKLDLFNKSLQSKHPPLAHIARLQVTSLPEQKMETFVIRHSEGGETATVQVAPDTYVCPDCLRELFDPADRRYRYPFINCINCGPRFTIINDVPYDRAATTMADFAMCPACRREYEDPEHRRFHAQPNACPECGPHLTLLDADGEPIPNADPVNKTVQLLKDGAIVAIKGLGGYHLAVDARNDAALEELRRRKGRDEKPFALMARDLNTIRSMARVSSLEERLLNSWERPIVLLGQKEQGYLAAGVAPNNRYLGVMLPYTPLHFLLLIDLPVLVMTSANLSDEPIVFRDEDALESLSGIADAYLTHDRRIETRCDDSIARVMDGEPLLLRRSRGFAPRAVYLPQPQQPTLALGAELKNTICLVKDTRAFLSQHIGDLKNAETLTSLEQSIEHLGRLLDIRPQLVAHDLHPDYLSTRAAERYRHLPTVAVQHHHAHLAGVLADNGFEGPAIGLIFDGLGYGSDDTIWGGEFLVGDALSFERAGHFAYLAMPGGDVATREPRRMALSALVHAYGEKFTQLPLLLSFKPGELKLLTQMLEKGLNAPLASSCGRLFDAVAALSGLRQTICYEGQAALELEMVLDRAEMGRYPYELIEQGGMTLFEPAPLIRAVVDDVLAGVATGIISARFHNALVAMVREVCDRLRRSYRLETVALSGGVFQNLTLLERVSQGLVKDGFRVCRHRQVPPNDGGLSLGQAVVAGALQRAGRL